MATLYNMSCMACSHASKVESQSFGDKASIVSHMAAIVLHTKEGLLKTNIAAEQKCDCDTQ
jgi:hypothetical protein